MEIPNPPVFYHPSCRFFKVNASVSENGESTRTSFEEFAKWAKENA